MRDLQHNILAVHSLVPILCNTTAEGTGVGVDLAGFDGCAMAVLVGDSGDTLSGSVYWTIAFQESDSQGSGFANIAAADLIGGANDVVINAPTADQIVVQRGYIGGKRYVRTLCTQTGTHTNGTPMGSVVIKGQPRHAPTA
jgi:hypothetical protein